MRKGEVGKEKGRESRGIARFEAVVILRERERNLNAVKQIEKHPIQSIENSILILLN